MEADSAVEASSGDRSDVEVMLDAVLDRGIVKLDPAGRISRWNAGARSMFGYPDTEILGRPMSILHTDTDQANGLAHKELIAAQRSGRVEFEGWRVRKDGRRFQAGVTISTICDPAGTLTGFTKITRDLAADQQRTHSMFHDLLEAAPDAIVIVDADGRITLANAQTDRLFGYPRQQLIGSEIETLLPPRFRINHIRHRADFLTNPVLRQMGSGLELWGQRHDGTQFPVDISLSPLHIGENLYVSAAIRDITERHQSEQQLRHQHDELLKMQEELQRLARVDTLTGLVNHAETITRLEAALRNQRLPASHLGLLYCDVDRFKAINDTFGHPVGDIVLAAVAARIRDCLRDGDTVGRTGGDEMLVILPTMHNINEVTNIAERIRRHVAEPIQHLDQTIHTTVSIGATLARPGESVPELTTRADTAMYKAKKAGRNKVTTI
ncbi:MAG TPA: diguanylate cyclase [Gordonia sp. (in: high G+C Gram-positive bacteria)]|uniref:diguanylate cyclase domain-containing protein n=1 Tax=Gordonia sp. (in: high G+C Gram-positive bacteria) TaxID=84139 RepID=UPI002D14BC9E|nr:diguanylate cyclase [Gordonia sp. (in: high G+C Gram-positive bacteria)]HRC52345.1 diguanylate cyclase [Gordonia sp. (in: high G+C Gram-positive bacteria)]